MILNVGLVLVSTPVCAEEPFRLMDTPCEAPIAIQDCEATVEVDQMTTGSISDGSIQGLILDFNLAIYPGVAPRILRTTRLELPSEL